MQIQCEYCGTYMPDTAEQCPHCGAPNAQFTRAPAGTPKTIGELRAFCAEKKLPLEKMRFFIGENYHEPKAFGIYRDERSGDFVVYKNKADGSRAIRYRGKDEAYAVNELYEKLHAEVQNQRAFQAGRHQATRSAAASGANARRGNGCLAAVLIAAVICAVLIVAACIREQVVPIRGYYLYEDSCYYHNLQGWFIYDDGWTPVTADRELNDNYRDYWSSSEYDSSYGAEDFFYSDYWSSRYDSDSESDFWDSDDDDDDWDWGSDDWDSDSTDWDSDW